jgi:Bacteriophage lambda head decoration protein D
MSTETIKAGAFILSEGAGDISRDTITVETGEVLTVGTVLGKVTASDTYVAYSNVAVDGSEVAAGILYDDVDATSADTEAVMIARMAEVADEDLTGLDAAGQADLAALDIIVRA